MKYMRSENVRNDDGQQLALVANNFPVPPAPNNSPGPWEIRWARCLKVGKSQLVGVID